MNTDYDKKYAKYTLDELPKEYGNVKEYMNVIKQAHGKEWVSLLTHEQLSKPKLQIKRGKNIQPLERIDRKKKK